MKNIYQVDYLIIFIHLLLQLKTAAVNPACECVIMRRSSLRENGFFNSPNYPFPYPPLINCILYTFIGFLEDIVELHFLDFNIQSQTTNRCSDYLKFFLDLQKPEVNERNEWNYELCGNMSMISRKHYSSTPYLIFEFHTDNVHTNHTGFKGTFNFFKKKGKFFSPSYPQNYLPNSRCLYHFYGKSDERVAFLFDEIELEEHDQNCDNSPDNILIRDGVKDISPILTKFCGNKKSVQVISSFNTALVEFKSDSRKQRKGFSAQFNFFPASKIIFNKNEDTDSNKTFLKIKNSGSEIRNFSVIGESWKQEEFGFQEKDFPADSLDRNSLFTLPPLNNQVSNFTLYKMSRNCNHIYSSLSLKSGYFSSPGYPTSIYQSVVCHYVFEGMENERVQLIFNDFDLTGPEEKIGIDPHECEDFDTLKVSINIKGEIRNLLNQCGRTIPHQLMSHNNRMEAIFTSKQRYSNVKGFKGVYNFVKDFGIKNGFQDDIDCRFIYRSESSSNGTFTSPNFPGLYPRNTECHYLFYGQQSENIIIIFQTLDVEGVPPTCAEDTHSDFVEFSNFNVHLIDRKMSRICGTKREQTRKAVTSDGNFFRVSFKSNDIYDATGFQAFYQFKRNEDPLTSQIHLSRAITSRPLIVYFTLIHLNFKFYLNNFIK